jgi:hypothetical protein
MVETLIIGYTGINHLSTGAGFLPSTVWLAFIEHLAFFVGAGH